MVVDQPDALHERVHDRRAHESHAASLQVDRQGVRGGRRGRDAPANGGPREGRRGTGHLRSQVGVERSEFGGEKQQDTGVLDRRVDLGPIAHDPGVGHEPGPIVVVERRNRGGIEAPER